MSRAVMAEKCPVCARELRAGRVSWHWECKGCGYEKGQLQANINSPSVHRLIDEEGRAAGLRKLRMENFKRVLASVKSLKPRGGRLLDVGCAHGWFLEAAKHDFEVHGLEPDESVLDQSRRRGLDVRCGYFPDALEDEEKFSVISFNDVIEHIPDIEGILGSCRRHLEQDGLLVINLPSSDGVFYKLSKILCRIGYRGFFGRLWQKGLPSPHVHYFHISNLTDLLRKSGFELKIKGRLAVVRLTGLYSRLSYTGDFNFAQRILLYVGIAMFLPVLRVLPSDIIYVVAKKSSDT